MFAVMTQQNSERDPATIEPPRVLTPAVQTEPAKRSQVLHTTALAKRITERLRHSRLS